MWALKNDVQCIQSLYEADAGLQHLEDVGLTDGTFSEDGDFFVLGSKLWATKVSIIKGMVMIFNSTIIREALSEKILKGVVVPGPRSRSYRIVLRYTTHRTLQSVVSS